MDFTVIVTSWGHPSWAGRASRVAIPSADDQAPVVHHHDSNPVRKSAGEIRNDAVDFANPKGWICFLDADDQLGDGYVEKMSLAIKKAGYHRTNLFIPKLELPGQEPEHYTDRDIIDGLNPCPIGTVIHRDMFERVGRFWDEPDWEDWSLFRRGVLVGERLRWVDAIYRANSTRQGRNSTVRNPHHLRRTILRSHDLWKATL